MVPNRATHHKCPSEISCVMDNELKLLTDWLTANKLSLNESKAKLLIFRLSGIFLKLRYYVSKENLT